MRRRRRRAVERLYGRPVAEAVGGGAGGADDAAGRLGVPVGVVRRALRAILGAETTALPGDDAAGAAGVRSFAGAAHRRGEPTNNCRDNDSDDATAVSGLGARTAAVGVEASSRTRVESAWPSSALADDFLGDGVNDAFDPRLVKR